MSPTQKVSYSEWLLLRGGLGLSHSVALVGRSASAKELSPS